jgi:uncharacterized protein YukE
VGLNDVRRREQKNPVFVLSLLVAVSLAVIFLLVVIVSDSDYYIPGSGCTNEVCATSLDPNAAATNPDISPHSADGSPRQLRNYWLTIAAIAFGGLMSIVVTVIGVRLLLSRSRSSPGDYRAEPPRAGARERTMTIPKKIDAHAESSQEAIERIKDILSKSGDQNVGNAPLSDILRAAGRVPDAQQALQDIRASIKNEGASSNSSFSKAPTETYGADIRRLELLVHQRNQQIERLNDELDHLKKRVREASVEIEGNKSQGEAAIRSKLEAERLLASFAAGLPDFVSTRQEGSRFASFLEFLNHANTISPQEVSRLGIMLRVVNSAMFRGEITFELTWSVHEVGKSLYSVMRSLGYDENTCHEEASAWAHALNRFGQGKFAIFVPAVKTAFSGLEMTGGTPQTAIQEVKSWGVRNKLGDVDRKAVVK